LRAKQDPMVNTEQPRGSVKPGVSSGMAVGSSRPLARSGHFDALCRMVVR